VALSSRALADYNTQLIVPPEFFLAFHTISSYNAGYKENPGPYDKPFHRIAYAPGELNAGRLTTIPMRLFTLLISATFVAGSGSG
jgi:hypothetical protein